MMSVIGKVWDWFGTVALPYFWEAFKSLGVLILDGLKTFFPIIKVAIFLFPLMEMFLVSLEKLGASLASLNLSNFTAADSNLLAYGAFFNRLMPLSEFFAIQTILLLIWSVVIAIRWVKSFIPTVAN